MELIHKEKRADSLWKSKIWTAFHLFKRQPICILKKWRKRGLIMELKKKWWRRHHSIQRWNINNQAKRDRWRPITPPRNRCRSQFLHKWFEEKITIQNINLTEREFWKWKLLPRSMCIKLWRLMHCIKQRSLLPYYRYWISWKTNHQIVYWVHFKYRLYCPWPFWSLTRNSRWL